ncbi:hypothetical protein BH10PSE17_BH10PSE17_17400 [soil metagenome]
MNQRLGSKHAALLEVLYAACGSAFVAVRRQDSRGPNDVALQDWTFSFRISGLEQFWRLVAGRRQKLGDFRLQRLLSNPTWRALCIAVLLSAALALLGRYGLMENEGLGTICKDTGGSPWCTPWTWLPQLFVNNRLGIMALAAALLAALMNRRGLAWLGLVLGTVGLVLYCYELSAVALVGCLVLLLRGSARQADPR